MSGVGGAISNFASCTAKSFSVTFQEKLSDLLRLILGYWVWYGDMTMESVIMSVKCMAVTSLTMNWLGCFSELLQGSFSSLKGGVSGVLGS